MLHGRANHLTNRLLALATVVCGVGAGLLPATTHGAAAQPARSGGAAPAYITLAFGRTLWQESTGTTCDPSPGAVSLDTVATDLAARGLTGTGFVVDGRIQETTRACLETLSYSSWADLAHLRDDFGWTFVSNGLHRRPLAGLTSTGKVQEACGSLDLFAAHGHDRAWGMYGPGSNKITAQDQADYVEPCFAYTRIYSGTRSNTRAGLASAPFSAKTLGIHGGLCNDSALPCFTSADGAKTRYQLPADLLTAVPAGGDRWAVVLGYRFVRGTVLAGPGAHYDCSSADVAAHWVGRSELYCYDDYLWFIDHLPAGLTSADPATVAEAWGRIPTPKVEVTSATSNGSTVQVSFDSFESGAYDIRSSDGCAGAVLVSGAYSKGPTIKTASFPAALLGPGIHPLSVCLTNAFGHQGFASTTVTI